MGYIEKIHQRNFDLISEKNIVVGSSFQKDFNTETVAHIHPLYGWIKTDKGDAQKVPQEVSLIFKKGWKKM